MTNNTMKSNTRPTENSRDLIDIRLIDIA